MKRQPKDFRYYEKIMKTDLDQNVTETIEYQRFSEVYPHIAESIKLKRKLKRLNNQLKSKEHENSKFKIKREINLTKSKLQKNKLSKRLHRENKQEAAFRKQLKHKASKVRHLLLKKKTSSGTFRLKIRRYLHRKLPPTLLNLRDHDVSEKGQVLKEWLQEKNKELNNVLHK